jgi:hypothetical protein
LIADGHPPAWLVRYLSHYVSAVRDARAQNNQTPRRAELRDGLHEVIKLVERLAVLLEEGTHVYGEVMRGKSPSILSPSLLLRDIAERAKIQLDAHPKRGGRDRAVPMIHGRKFRISIYSSVAPEIHCAIHISEGWLYLRRRAPGVRNEAAWNACENYWRATGDVLPARDEELGRWERVLRAAKKYPAEGRGAFSSDRAAIRSDLEGRRWGTE